VFAEGAGLKILHAPFIFHPDPVGGTEVYVANLAAAQIRRGAGAVIAAPGVRAEQYTAEHLEVYRFATEGPLDLRQLYGEGDPNAAAGFARVLKATRPDLVHLHAFTSGVSLRVVRLVKQAGLPVVFTYHTPTVSCQRGTLLRWGTELCDGRLDVCTCTACSLNGQGVGQSIARWIARVPAAAGRVMGSAGLSGSIWTALRMTELVTLRQQAFRDLMVEVDRVISLCSWTTDLLVANGVPPEKVTLCRHGLAPVPEAKRPGPSRPPGEACRIVFIGRITPVKGLDVLIQAIAGDPALAVSLDIYGVVQGSGGAAYREQLEKRADGRIHFHEPVPPQQVIEEVSHYDVLAVPSTWLETGPLVVLEAFAAGIPVMGSDLGGIRELVRHDIDGLLVEPGSVSGWRETLRRLCREPGLLERLRRGIQPPRTMDRVAADMLSLYGELLEQTGRPVLSR
jgi:glycosyltransferase involved in cell wall biosynthesis